MPGGLGVPLLGELQPPGASWDHRHQPQLWVPFDGGPFVADHQVGDVRLPRLEHGQAGRTLRHAFEDDAFDRGSLAPVALVRLQNQLDAGLLADETIRPEPDRMAFKAIVAYLR